MIRMSRTLTPAGSSRRGRPRADHTPWLAAASDVVRERGYAAASVEAIAAAAEVGKQTLYRRWPNRASLFIEVYESLVPRDLMVEDSGSLRDDFQALLARLADCYQATPAADILAGLIAEAQSDPTVAAQLRATYVVPRRAIVGDLLDRAVRRGEIASGQDADFVSDLLSSAVWFRLLLGERELDDEFRANLVTTLVGRLTWPGPTR